MTPTVQAFENLSVHEHLDATELADSRAIRSVYVYETPVRIWHWVNALSIVVLCVTGYLIGSPLPTQPGEASANFLMGYIRFVHFSAGYVLAVGLLGRIYWAIVGNRYAREMFWIPLRSRAYWEEIVSIFKWYAFVGSLPKPHVGHNPLARFTAMFGFLPISVFMVFTGFALYSEGAQRGSWQDMLFGWVIPLFGQSQDVHTWHHLGMWALVCYAILHVYAAVGEDIIGRSSMLSSMVSGHRIFKD